MGRPDSARAGAAPTTAPPPATDGSSDRTWEPRRRGRARDGQARITYYDQPAIHKPHWKWLIITYFFLGGIAGGSYVIASIAELFGSGEQRPIVRAGRLISLAALLPCPALLILDLGRPERFLNMLRVVKLRSPMSIGTWGLTIFGEFCTLSALAEAARSGLLGEGSALTRLGMLVPSRVTGAIGTIPGFFVGGYTGVLLAATAVPLWTRNHLLMGPLFLTSGLASAAAAISLVLALARGTSRESLASLERLGAITHLAELGLILATRANAGARLARPLERGRLRPLFRFGVIGLGILAPLAIETRSLVQGKAPSRPEAMLSSLCALVGGYLLRYVMVMAGYASADDPRATFELTQPPR